MPSSSLQLADNAYGTLASGLAVGDTTLTFTSGHGARFPAVAAGQVLNCCILNSNNTLEEIQITAHTAGADSATIVRAAGGTTAKVWNAGDRIEARLSSEVLNRMRQEMLVGVAITTTDTGQSYLGTHSPVLKGLVTGALYPVQVAVSNTGSAPTVDFDGLGAVVVKNPGGNSLSPGQLAPYSQFAYDGTNLLLFNPPTATLMVAATDETTVITTGSAKVTFRMPYQLSLTKVRGSLVSPSTATGFTVDVTHAGTSIFSTKLTFDANESTTESAATPAVLAVATLNDDAIMTVNIDGAGANAKGLKVTLLGRQ